MTRIANIVENWTPQEGKGDITAIQLVKANENSFAQNTEGVTALSVTKSDLVTLELGDDAQALEYLYLSENKSLKKVVFEKALPNLTHIYIDGCDLEEIVFPKGFEQLKQIYVPKQKNKLKRLVFEGDCPKLQLLDASGNDLKEFTLPVIFENLEYLYLGGNEAIANIPKEIYQNKKNSWEDVRNYLDSGDKKEYLHEAKMILIGNGEVGKSSIRIKLLDEKAPLPKIEDRTQALHGVIEPYLVEQIAPSVTNLKKNINFKLNIWDFGGQGRYREVQALFCSRKSLYVFVTSPDDKSENEDYVGHEYWLSMANAFSSEQKEDETLLSPVIYVLNKVDIEKGDKTIQETDIKKQFANVEHFIKISCQTLFNFTEFKTAVRTALPKVGSDIFSDKYAFNWLLVKKKLEEKARKGINYISKDEYLVLCRNESLNDSEAETWLGVLDRIGTVMYFSKHYNHEQLKDFIVLNPNWVRDAVCKVLDADSIEDARFYPSNFPKVWNEYNTTESLFQKVKSIFTPERYTQSEHEKLLALMLTYKLCYPQTDQHNKPFYVVPALLKNDKPNLHAALRKFDYEIRFNYEPFIPPGTLNKLMVSLYTIIYNDLKWKNGVILHDIETGAFAEITESWKEKRLYLKLKGGNIKILYARILNTLQGLIQDLKNTKLMNQLSFDIEACDEGTWMSDALLKKFKVERYSFLWEESQMFEKGVRTEEIMEKSIPNSEMNMLQFENGYALLIGIAYEGRWENKYGLKGTLNDVKQLSELLTHAQKAAYKSDNVVTILEKEATTQRILNGLNLLAQKTLKDPDATVIIYYSGHGVVGSKTGKSYLVPYDYQQQDSNNTLIESKVFAQKIAAINAKKLLIILDCCHSESMVTEKQLDFSTDFLTALVSDLNTSFENPSVLEKNFSAQNLQSGGGRIILTSCQANETSLDLGKNGLFTEVLLECLNGANNNRNDGWVMLEDLLRIRTIVPQRAAQYTNSATGEPHNQHPMFKRIDNLTHEEFIICAYDIAKAKNFDSSLTAPQHIPLRSNELDAFKAELKEHIDANEFSEVFSKIKSSSFDYEKSSFTRLEREFAYQMSLALIDQLKVFIGTLRFKK